MKTSGYTVHCHENTLVEWCYDYDERVAAIMRDKPATEQETRLKLFQVVPMEAIVEIPKQWLEANRKWVEANKEWIEENRKCNVEAEMYRKWTEAKKEWAEAKKEWAEADRKWVEANLAWDEADMIVWHHKWCGCAEWDGREIRFEKIEEMAWAIEEIAWAEANRKGKCDIID